MSKTVEIFKLVSGELIIAQVDNAGGDLRRKPTFTAFSPMIVQITHQGYGLVPMFVWCDPKAGAKATFYGETVCMVADASEPQHAEFVKSYNKLVSVVSLDTTFANVLKLR